MSDIPTQPAHAGGGSIGPDGSTFDPARWDSYVQHTKAEKAELKRELEAANGVWEDEQAVLARLQERFPHLMVEDEDTPEPDLEPDTPLRDPRYDEIAPRVDQVVAWQAEQQYASDLKQVAGERPLTDFAKRTIKHLTAEGGNNRQALEQAVKDWFEYEDSQAPAERKSAPTPPQPGKAAAEDYHAEKDPAKRRQARRARIAAQVEAGMQQQ